MVVIAGLTGSGALGLETVYGLTKGEVGRGVAGGVSIVLLAIALDRITQAWGTRHRRRGSTHEGERTTAACWRGRGGSRAAARGGGVRRDDDDDDDADERRRRLRPAAATAAADDSGGRRGAGRERARASRWPSTRGPARPSTPTWPRSCSSRLGTPVELVDIDENATWPGLDAGDLDAVLEVWPSGHVDDYETYVTDKATVVDLGELGPVAKIGWYVPSYVLEEHPELATWEGLKDPELATIFATAETGDKGQFLMGDPSYVSYDEQIIANLELPLQFVVAGSEAAEITAVQQAVEAERAAAVLLLAAALAALAARAVRDRAARGHRGVQRRPRRRATAPTTATTRRTCCTRRRRRARGEEPGGVRLPAEVPADDRAAERDRRARRQRGHDGRRRRPAVGRREPRRRRRLDRLSIRSSTW